MESNEGSWLSRNLFLVVSITTGSLFACALVLVILSRVFANTLSVLSLVKTPKLPPGVFLKIKEGLIELDKTDKIPVEGGISFVSNVIFQKQPGMVIRETKVDLDNLELYKLDQHPGETRKVIPYDATTGEDGAIELTLSSPLEEGVYCLIQRDPSSAVLSGWCFELGNPSKYPAP